MKTAGLCRLCLLLAAPLWIQATKLQNSKGTVVCPPGGAACQCNCAAAAQAMAAPMGMPGMPQMMGAPGMAAMAPMVPPPQAPPPPPPPPPPAQPPPPPAAPMSELPPMPAVAPLDMDDLPTLAPLPPAKFKPTAPPLPVLAMPTVPPIPTAPPFPYERAAAALTMPSAAAMVPPMATSGLQSLTTIAGQATEKGELKPHYYQYVPGFGYFLMPGTPDDAEAGTAAAVKTSAKGCACLKEWSMDGAACNNYCCNPDDSAGDWCFVEDEECEGDTWGTCATALLQMTSNATSSRGVVNDQLKIIRKSSNPPTSFLQKRQDNVEGAECDCED